MQPAAVNKQRQAIARISNLRTFIGYAQRAVLNDMISNSEESEFFINQVSSIDQVIRSLPRIYETEGISMDEKLAVLHYFSSNSDFYIVERDMFDS